MPARAAPRRAIALLPLLALLLAGCGTTVSTSGFSGEKHAVAQAVADLQSDATANDERKVCANDLASAVVTRLGGTKGCEKALKTQLAEIDSLEVNVQSIELGAGSSSATAHVTSTVAGKSKRRGTISLVKEAKAWRTSAMTP